MKHPRYHNNHPVTSINFTSVYACVYEATSNDTSFKMSVVYLLFHLLFFVVAVISSQASESIYLVTSPDDHCPWEFTADKSCLTLEQYTLNPILGSNTSLRLVSGSHLLNGHGLCLMATLNLTLLETTSSR